VSLRVITPPAPLVVPADIAGSHAPDDAKVIAAIAAVTAEIDGPTGWLGRAIGPQTLELRLDGFDCGEIRLPRPPIIGNVEVRYLDADLGEQTFDADNYELLSDGRIWLRNGASWPSLGMHPEPIRIRYQAGYNGTPVADGGTGDVPARIKQAIIVMVQDLIATKSENLFLRSDEVEGVGTRQYTVSDQAGTIIRRTADRLLQGLRIYA
jgi:hypothetical protein